MKNFNLLVSTSRYNEVNAKAELWFTLLLCGDDYPILSRLNFPGLIAGLTNLNVRNVISNMKQILKKDSNFFQFILKIIPIDFVCETSVQVINQIVQMHYKDYIFNKDSFRIILKRRKSEQIERVNFINKLAKKIPNKVDLEKPDKIVRIEILGNITGISFLTKEEIIKSKVNKYNVNQL
ncbi:MAG: THUMP domain-containing protein [Promethearchaeota archaeon]